jgi:pimeloyl-ACP methyl ester carboxylesterase
MLLTSGALAASSIAHAQAQIAFAPCGDSNNFACGHLTVPLDPSGATAGTLTLAMRRHRAAIEGTSSAVVVLAGGPGQAAIPLTEPLLELLGPVVASRDLIVFDQRGTGLSHALSCPPPKHGSRVPPTVEQAIIRCAEQVGPGRSFYTTPDSVADIEAIRRAGGYDKLVLYGTSYGTKVAEQYAQAYPTHVEALVLDSVVTPNGPDPLSRSTFAAVPRVLRQLCSHHECAQITRDPVADLARVVTRVGHGSLAGRVIDKRGRPHSQRIESDALIGVLLAGDFDPLLRAEFIPAVRAAAGGDTAALARLLAGGEGSEGGGGEGIDGPLFLTTTCEDEPFAWSRSAPPRTRLSQARAQLGALGASVFSPFAASNAFDLSTIGACAFWPYSTPPPPLDTRPLPTVPTLLLSGASDLRTPTANAREVGAQIPGSHLLIVPYTGHSVLTSATTPCPREALQAMFAGHAIHTCEATAPSALLKLPPLPPARLGDVPPTRGYHGSAGRTLHAVSLTLGDFGRHFLLALLESLSSGGFSKEPSIGGGGLRAGWYQLTNKAIDFHGYSYVPGVTISGALSSTRVELVVGGSAAAPGSLRLDHHGGLVGTLGGTHVQIAHGAPSKGALLASVRPRPLAQLDARTIGALSGLSRMLERLPQGSVDLAELARMLRARRISEPSLPR